VLSAMDLHEFMETVPNLTDLELAVLLGLIAKQHCLVYTDDDLVDSLESELSLIVSETFKLSYKVLSHDDLQSVDKFGEAILDQDRSLDDESDVDIEKKVAAVRSRIKNVNFGSSLNSKTENLLDNRMVVNVLIAKNFNYASRDVQTQAVELMLNRRMFSRTTVHPVPETFLFLPIVATSTKHVRLSHHLVRCPD
jgi:hypothetical protein